MGLFLQHLAPAGRSRNAEWEGEKLVVWWSCRVRGGNRLEMALSGQKLGINGGTEQQRGE